MLGVVFMNSKTHMVVMVFMNSKTHMVVMEVVSHNLDEHKNNGLIF